MRLGALLLTVLLFGLTGCNNYGRNSPWASTSLTAFPGSSTGQREDNWNRGQNNANWGNRAPAPPGAPRWNDD
jgi:hypothetical protein